MADQPRSPDADDDTGAAPNRGATTGTPRWQKVVGIIGLLVILLVAIMLFVGGGHGPGRHGAISSVADGAVEIAVTANDLAFEPDEITVTSGEDVAIALRSIDILHDFTIDEFDAHVAAGPGETATGGFRADRSGRYTFYCAEPGHQQAGMEGTLIVEPGGLTPEDFEDLRG